MLQSIFLQTCFRCLFIPGVLPIFLLNTFPFVQICYLQPRLWLKHHEYCYMTNVRVTYGCIRIHVFVCHSYVSVCYLIVVGYALARSSSDDRASKQGARSRFTLFELDLYASLGQCQSSELLKQSYRQIRTQNLKRQRGREHFDYIWSIVRSLNSPECLK